MTTEGWAGILEVAAGVVIPSASIIISTVVAVRLARTERKAAAAARAEERAEADADRLSAQRDEAFVRCMEPLATLNTINVAEEEFAGPLRDLRVALTLLAIRGNDDLVSEWFDAERLAGARCGELSMMRLRRTGIPGDPMERVEAVIWMGGPVNIWAATFFANLQRWMKNGASEAELRDLIANAEGLPSKASKADFFAAIS